MDLQPLIKLSELVISKLKEIGYSLYGPHIKTNDEFRLMKRVSKTTYPGPEVVNQILSKERHKIEEKLKRHGFSRPTPYSCNIDSELFDLGDYKAYMNLFVYSTDGAVFISGLVVSEEEPNSNKWYP